MFDGSAGAIAFQTTRDWVTGATVACSNAPLRVCFVDRAGVPSQIAWRSSGADLAYVVPAYATRSCDVTGACQSVTPGATVMVGRMPTWFGPD